MQFSRPLKSSSHSLPSFDGAYIATILPSKITIRQTRSLEIVRTISLPDHLTSIQCFLWSPSSDKILVAVADSIRVYSIKNRQFSAIISNPTSGNVKTTTIAFGATDDEVIVFSDFGLKAIIFNLSTSTSIDINSPKFFQAATASKGYAYRPRTLECALLTRSAGKDVISIHKRNTYEVLGSWQPDTIDAQSLCWSPDGTWLVVVESAGQGCKVMVYTADGHLYKIWKGPLVLSGNDTDASLGAGIKILHWNTTGDLLAIGDYSSRVTLLSVPSFLGSMSLNHTATVQPVDGLQVWQEQITPSLSGGFERRYSLSSQVTCPPTTTTSPTTSEVNAKIGIAMLSSDTSGTLIATRVENMPTTVWIWDTASKVLKGLMIQHAPVAKITWHPTINELLMIRCEGEESKGLAHLWEPTWDAPKIINFGSQVPEGKIIGKSIVRWLKCEAVVPALFFSDSQDCMLAALSDGDEDLPWQAAVTNDLDISGEREESPLNLVPADEKRPYSLNIEALMSEEPTMTIMSTDEEEVDDTFHFKRFVGP